MLRRVLPTLLLLALLPGSAQSSRRSFELDWDVAVAGTSPEISVTAHWAGGIGSAELALWIDGDRVERAKVAGASGALSFAPTDLPAGPVEVELVWSTGRMELGRERVVLDGDRALQLGTLQESSDEPVQLVVEHGVVVTLTGSFPTEGDTAYEQAVGSWSATRACSA